MGAFILKFLMSDAIKQIIISIVSAFATFLIGFYGSEWFKRPKLSVSHQNRSAVRIGIESKTFGVKSEIKDECKAKLEGDSEFNYGFVCGYAKNPGYADIIFSLSNHGKAQAVIDGISIIVKSFESLDGQDYSLYKKGVLEETDQYVIFYACVDPVIKKAESFPVRITNGDIKIVKESNLRVPPGNDRTYYMRLAFTNYGVYKLKARLYYHYEGKTMYTDDNKFIYILYDNLNRKQILQKMN